MKINHNQTTEFQGSMPSAFSCFIFALYGENSFCF